MHLKLILFHLEPYARLDVFGLSLPNLFFVFLRRGLHFPEVLRPDTLRYIVKGEEGVVIVYMVKWQCSFKDSWSRHRLEIILASWSCPESNGRLLGVGRRESIGAAMELGDADQ